MVLLYDGVSAGEVLGPCEVLRHLPDTTCRFVAEQRRPHLAHSPSLSLDAGDTLEQVDWTDVLVIPGGFACRELIGHERLLEWIQHRHDAAQWTTAVSTGSVLLAAAGLLTGSEATTHWLARDLLAGFGATPVTQRVVRAGRILTATGPAAAIEAALWVAAEFDGPAAARAIRNELPADLDASFDPDTSWEAAATVAGWWRGESEGHSTAHRGASWWNRIWGRPSRRRRLVEQGARPTEPDEDLLVVGEGIWGRRDEY